MHSFHFDYWSAEFREDTQHKVNGFVTELHSPPFPNDCTSGGLQREAIRHSGH